MTPKQIERIQKKIRSIRASLAAERRRLGGYDDSGGRRYLPPGLYLKIGDYKGGMTYFRWFAKNFPDDIGMPDFLFEWTVVLFKVGKLNEASRKARETYFSNTYLLDSFLGRSLDTTQREEWSDFAKVDFLQYFSYSSDDVELADFLEWLEVGYDSEAFRSLRERFLHVNRLILDCENRAERVKLLAVLRRMKEEFSSNH